FAVWDKEQNLIPVGRAYTGLTNEQIKEIDKWIRSHTLEKHGPVRLVEPKHVFELGFDGIMTNKKTKVGLTLRFPRILRWRKDLAISEADTVEQARSLLQFEGITEVKQYQALDEFF
ncbi:MAG: hypothetical protein IH840_15970, partial [Candidatus Heimdallarchaeota archaeon]|nr:hypothetical protein [Candidatus Heimdallarchaeota archaeon]